MIWSVLDEPATPVLDPTCTQNRAPEGFLKNLREGGVAAVIFADAGVTVADVTFFDI